MKSLLDDFLKRTDGGKGVRQSGSEWRGEKEDYTDQLLREILIQCDEVEADQLAKKEGANAAKAAAVLTAQRQETAITAFNLRPIGTPGLKSPRCAPSPDYSESQAESRVES